MASSSSSSDLTSLLHSSILVVFLSFLIIPISNSQPQNIETFFPSSIETPAPAPSPPISPPSPPPPATATASGGSSSSRTKIAAAVAGTAAGTFIVSGLLFLMIRRCLNKRRRENRGLNSASSSAPGGDRRVVPQAETNVFERIDGNVRGLIVDENGLDVIYWRKLQGPNTKSKRGLGLGLEKEVVIRGSDTNKQEEEQEEEEENQRKNKSEPVQEIPLLRGMSSNSHVSEDEFLHEHQSNRSSRRNKSRRTRPLPPPPSSFSSASASLSAIPKEKSLAPSTSSASLSAIPKETSPSPPPPPPPPAPAPAPPPPPPPSMANNSKPSSKPPPAPMDITSKTGAGTSTTGDDKVKLKPLHWDKVNTNADHSMVWDKMDRGSFRVDQDLMEALFGFVATSRRTPKGDSNSKSPARDTFAAAPSSAKTFIFDSRKSQNIAIVLKSLAVSREEILDALHEGQGLNLDTIERLTRIAPTEEEQNNILEYEGDPKTLAAGESFLFDILKAVPSAFKRLNAMLFRLNYDTDILEIKESLNTLELGCKELRNRGLFVKLLEAVLKAGNRMNAGTSRGNAQAFNLSSLRKLNDVKSTDGKTTLLHFVVEEVVRSEGKRCVLNRDHSLNKRRNESENVKSVSDDDQREKEYLTLGLPFVGGISAEFSNVKKAAATIDYNTLVGSISTLSTRIAEIRKLVLQCGNDGNKGGNFVKEMEQFLRNAEEELKSVKNEQARVMQLVKRTTEYYQGGASKDNTTESLVIFAIVNDFLGMVDQACINIARNMQKKKKISKASSG